MKKDFWRFSHNEVNLIVAVLAVVIGIWAFIEISDEIGEKSVLEYDKQILMTLRSETDVNRPVGPDWLPEAMRDISSLGSKSVLTLMVLSVAGFLLLRRQYKSALLILLVSAVGTLLVVLLKLLFVRERPDIIPYLTEVSSKSYPSGHTMMSAVIYLSLATMLAHVQERRRVKFYSLGIAFLLTFLVGFSRLYLGVHYPTDVLAGWSVGLAWAALCWFFFLYIDQRKPAE